MKQVQQWGEGRAIETPALFEDYNGNLNGFGWFCLCAFSVVFWAVMLWAFMVGTGGF